MTAAIKLNQILGLDSRELSETKVRFNRGTAEYNALDVYLDNPAAFDAEWTLNRGRYETLRIGYRVLSLVHIEGDQWLLAGILKVCASDADTPADKYRGEYEERFRPLFGRVIVGYHKDTQQSARWANGLIDEMTVLEVLPEPYGGKAFPGYDSICLSFVELERIIRQHRSEWMGPLEHQQGVYAIADQSTGALYIGSATSLNGGILGRWAQYIETGHGGNVMLADLINAQGIAYARRHFQFALLENYNMRVDPHRVLEREAWWKQALATRVNGYNAN